MHTLQPFFALAAFAAHLAASAAHLAACAYA